MLEPPDEERRKRLLREASQRWRERHPERSRQVVHDYQTRVGRSVLREREYRQRQATRLAVLHHYGGECACCSEQQHEFLTIDHIDGGGREHRRMVERRGYPFYAWLRREGFPSGFRVLCWNCHMAHSQRHYRRLDCRFGFFPPEFPFIMWPFIL